MLIRIPPKKEPRYELLVQGLPPPALYGVNPRSIMGKAEWDKLRKEAYARSGYSCDCCCGNPAEEPLEAHERYEIDDDLGTVTLLEIVALCSFCHMFAHRHIWRQRDLDRATRKRFNAAFKYGSQLLTDHGSKHGIRWPVVQDRYRTPHERWRLIWDGREYPPIHEEA